MITCASYYVIYLSSNFSVSTEHHIVPQGILPCITKRTNQPSIFLPGYATVFTRSCYFRDLSQYLGFFRWLLWSAHPL